MQWNRKISGYLAFSFIVLMILVFVTRNMMIDDLPDFKSFSDVKDKKRHFFDFIRPIVEAENKKVLMNREKLLMLEQQYSNVNTMHPNDEKWVKNLAKIYKVRIDTLDDQAAWTSLKHRVDIVPVPLALAQSANESGWGTSRFAQEGNNFFGQWCFIEGCGLVPARRGNGETHEVAVFNSVEESVAYYILNLNTLNAYQPLRTIRQEHREEGKTSTGLALAVGLNKYSERGEEYVEDIQAMIRINKPLMLSQ
ncbi:MAG: glucosaminidase domain-containing protein [Pseudomonadota bacterium]|nr:glucosaminidase domain-containing protein [Pseudomonadota bacterium]MDO7711245.1 glucosaminidase domain-containing protein [Pseudomonadota bacterium]